MDGLSFDVAHLLAGGLVLVSFMMLYQDRLYALLNVFALQAVVLAMSVAWQAWAQGAPHLYITAAIALVLKAIVIPMALHRIIARLGIHREIETVVGVGPTMIAGIGLVALSMVVMLRVTPDADPLAREDLAFALSVLLLGLLMMVTRRNAVSQVVGFMSIENGLILAGTGAKGMPLVVEISIAFSVLVAFIVIGIFLFRIRERFDTVDVQALDRFRGGPAMNGIAVNGVTLILAVPAATAALLAFLPGYRLSARLNVLSAFVTLLAALSLFAYKPEPGPYILVDDLNIVFIVLSSFVGFTTSVFSASYIAHELETGRLKPVHLRFYHAMYQVLLFAMNLALVANNIGLMWVAIELATLTTVLMVGIYRTHEALEAAWKYFILGSVGIALALFGTILVYMAARPVVGEGLDGMVWTVLIQARRRLRSGAAQRRLRVPAAGLRHQGRPRPAARLAPRCPCRRPDADLGGALRPPAQCRALCRAALQDAARGEPRRARARAADGDDGPHLAHLRRLHAVPPPRHQADVRLLVHRAHGHHRVRLRHGGTARQFRRPAPHDHAQPDQVRDLLHRRPHRPGQGHAAHRRHQRPDGDPSHARLGARRRRGRDRRHAAARHLHERIPGGELDLRAQPAAGAGAGRRAAGRVRRAAAAPAGPRLRRAHGKHRAGRRRPTCRPGCISGWC